jgi:hypothetical protein
MRGASYQSWNMKWISGPRKVRMNWGGMLVGCISISWLINPMNTIVTCRSHKPLLLDWTKSICVDFPFQPSIYGGTPMTMETPWNVLHIVAIGPTWAPHYLSPCAGRALPVIHSIITLSITIDINDIWNIGRYKSTIYTIIIILIQL